MIFKKEQVMKFLQPVALSDGHADPISKMRQAVVLS
jgi:hypothetical protein